MSYKSFPLLAVLVLSAMQLHAQRTTGQPATGGGQPSTPSPGGAGPGTPGGVIQPGQGNPRQPGYPGQQQRTDPYSLPDREQVLFLSGKVVMDDGTPPPEPVLIERVCNGTARPEGYTDSKGRFSFQLGQNNAIMADASTSGTDPVFGNPMGGNRRTTGGMGAGSLTSRLMGCELRATLAGFRSESVDLSNRRYMDNPDVGTMILRRLAKVEGFTFSATTAMAPKDARKAYEKGLAAMKKQKWPDAEKELQKAVDTYPKFAVAWSELGAAYQSQSKLDEARHAYGEAIKADAKFVTPYAQVMRIAAAQNKWDEAAEYATKAIKLNPYLPSDVYFISGVANYQIRKLDDAEENAREALKMDTQHRNPRINQLLGVILAEKSDLPGAAEAMRNYLKFAPNAADVEKVKQQLVEIERNMSAREQAKPAQ